MFNVGDTVRVLPPFDSGCPQTYPIEQIVINEDGSVVYLLTGAGSFSADYLEAA